MMSKFCNNLFGFWIFQNFCGESWNEYVCRFLIADQSNYENVAKQKKKKLAIGIARILQFSLQIIASHFFLALWGPRCCVSCCHKLKRRESQLSKRQLALTLAAFARESEACAPWRRTLELLSRVASLLDNTTRMPCEQPFAKV